MNTDRYKKHFAQCRNCGADILIAFNGFGSKIPIDRRPIPADKVVPAGRFVVVGNSPVAVYDSEAEGEVFIIHHSVCPVSNEERIEGDEPEHYRRWLENKKRLETRTQP